MTISDGSAGRPRAAAIDEALVAAFEALIAEMPLREFSVRALVARAGTTRDAFYRRYATLGHFFIEVALGRHATDPTADTGSVAGDLLVILRAQIAMYNDPLASGLLPLILDSSFRDPVTAGAFSEQFIRPQRAAVVKVLERAVARGEIDPIEDVGYLIDQLYAPMLFRAALPAMARIDEGFARAIAASVLRELGVANAGDEVARAVTELNLSEEEDEE